jgi:hypothetical protein
MRRGGWLAALALGIAAATSLLFGPRPRPHRHRPRDEQHLARFLDAAPDLERMAPAPLSIVCFRYVPRGWSHDDPRLDALTTAIMQQVQAGGEAFLTNATLRGRQVLRACVLHYATTESDLAALVGIVRRTGAVAAAHPRVAARPPRGGERGARRRPSHWRRRPRNKS